MLSRRDLLKTTMIAAVAAAVTSPISAKEKPKKRGVKIDTSNLPEDAKMYIMEEKNRELDELLYVGEVKNYNNNMVYDFELFVKIFKPGYLPYTYIGKEDIAPTLLLDKHYRKDNNE